jgi:transcriptional regulator with XRE-family HTH domain
MDQVSLPRNQIAAQSGLSNAYIRELEQGNIVNVGRDKLIAFAVAMNISLQKVDELLEVFDRAKLSEADIPHFVNTAKKKRFTSALLPVKDDFTLGLSMLSSELRPGPHLVVSSEPTVCLRLEGHRLYTQRRLVKSHPIYRPLVETLGRERFHALVSNLGSYPVDNYLCRSCLEDYMRTCSDPHERSWRVKHLQNVAWFVQNSPNWNLFLMNACPTFSFTLKQGQHGGRQPDRLIITRQPPHRFQGARSGKLAGFVTSNEVMVEHFKHELESLYPHILGEYRDRDKLVRYLQNLASEYTQGSDHPEP